jgi:hypothetical protein
MQKELETFKEANKEKIKILTEMINSDEMTSKDTKCSQALKDLNKYKADIDKFKQINEKHNKQGELLD